MTHNSTNQKHSATVTGLKVVGWSVAIFVGLIVLLAIATPTASTPIDPTDTRPAVAVTERQLAQIERNPDAHVGERIILHGKVSQADSNTGTSIIRVEATATPTDEMFPDTVNTLVRGDFVDVVEGDTVTLNVQVAGAHTYDTMIGGSATALLVDKIG